MTGCLNNTETQEVSPVGNEQDMTIEEVLTVTPCGRCGKTPRYTTCEAHGITIHRYGCCHDSETGRDDISARMKWNYRMDADHPALPPPIEPFKIPEGGTNCGYYGKTGEFPDHALRILPCVCGNKPVLHTEYSDVMGDADTSYVLICHRCGASSGHSMEIPYTRLKSSNTASLKNMPSWGLYT